MSQLRPVTANHAAQKGQPPVKWRRRSLVRVRRPAWASVEPRARKG
jgi:hypothetical protein